MLLLFLLLLCSCAQHNNKYRNAVEENKQIITHMNKSSSRTVKKYSLLNEQKNKQILNMNIHNLPLKNLVEIINHMTNIHIALDSTLYDLHISLHMQSDIYNIIRYITEAHNIVFIDNMLKPDRIVTKTHAINFLMNSVDSSSDMIMSTEVSDKSQVKINHKSNTNFWSEFTENISMMVEKSKFSINKQAGILIATCPESVHLQLARYIQLLRQALSRKIILEARIVEVIFNNHESAGINWQKLMQLGETSHIDATGGSFAITLDTDISGMLKMLGEYGNIQTIANPFISVLNNHVAIFKSARDEVYFNIVKERNENRHSFVDKISSKSMSVPVGVMLMAQASIEDDEIILSLRPTISKVIEYKQDPASVEKSVVPVIHTKEMYTTISTKPNKIIAIGGLLEEDQHNTSSGLPFISKVPILGALFGRQSRKHRKSELVIIIQVMLGD